MSNARYEDDLVDSVVSFPAKNATKPGDQLDKAGQTILQLVQKAAGVADQNSRHALGMAQKLSDQLRSAEDRIARAGGGSCFLSGQGPARRAMAPSRLHGNRRSIPPSERCGRRRPSTGAGRKTTLMRA
jgi:hypothetical protein